MLRMGDSTATASFEELALPLLEALYNHALWLTRNAAESEDLVQETYLKGMRGFGSFTPGTNFRAWLHRILRNTFLTSRSGLRAAPTLSVEDDLERIDDSVADRSVESAVIARMDGAAVRRAIDELPLPFREVLLLCDVEEMSYREIAEVLSIPVGTVTSRLMRARRKVREALQR